MKKILTIESHDPDFNGTYEVDTFDRAVAKMLDEAFDSLAQPKAKFGEWQPIETAPRDGTPILVLNRDDGFDKEVGYRTYSNDIGVARWKKDYTDRFKWLSTACCDGVTEFAPVYWMPLPLPPKAKEEV